MRLASRFGCILLLFAITGCINPTHLQWNYVDDRDACREKSETQVGNYSTQGGYSQSDKDKNAALLQLFCECMKGHDWNVAGCPKPKDIAKNPDQPPSTVVVVQQQPPVEAAPLVVQQAPAPAPAPVAPPAQPAQPVSCPIGTHSAPVYKHHRFVKNACMANGPVTAPASAPPPTSTFTPSSNDQGLEQIINK